MGRIEQVQKESEPVRDLFYGDDIFCKTIEQHKFNRYVLDNEDNEIVLDRLITEKGIKLMVAPTGAGKSTSLIQRALQIVNKDDKCRVVIALPFKILALQQGNHQGVTRVIGGDEFDVRDDMKCVVTTYEKMIDIKCFCSYQKDRDKDMKIYFILDESHLLAMHNTFRREAVSNLIKCIEENLFHSVLLTTASPGAMSLFRADKMVEFCSTDIKPAMDRIEIVQVDDVVSYIQQLDLSKEYPLVRLNNGKKIEEVIQGNPQFTRLTSVDKDTKVYEDLVEYSKIDDTNTYGIISSSLIEAGVNITEYPSNMVMIAAFADNNINVDSIEQFLNRARRTDTRHIECARVILPKVKKLSVVLADSEDRVLCEFNDVELVTGELHIKDTEQMDVLPDGNYFILVKGNGMAQKRKIQVSSVGKTGNMKYCKDSNLLKVSGVGFRDFLSILKYNYQQMKQFSEDLQNVVTLLFNGKLGHLIRDESLAEICPLSYLEIIENMCKTSFDMLGELKECISYQHGKVTLDKRILYLVSYTQFQRQYYWNVDELKKELESRMGVQVDVIQVDNEKRQQTTSNMQNLWEGIEHLREAIVCNRLYYRAVVERYYTEYTKKPEHKDIVEELRKCDHIIKLAKDMDKAGIEHTAILQILKASKSKSKVTQYTNAYKMITNNIRFIELEELGIKDFSAYSKKVKDKLQLVIYQYIKDRKNVKNITSLTVNDKLAEQIITAYKEAYPLAVKIPTARVVKTKLKQMYKTKDSQSIKLEMRLNVYDIFKLVKADYK